MQGPGLVDQRIDEAVRLVFVGSGFAIGEFDCGPDDWRWRSENWIGADLHIVFPRTAVWIEPPGHDPLLATVNEVLRYEPDARYRRRLAAREGDHCTFVLVEAALADQLGIAGRARSEGAAAWPALLHHQVPIGIFATQRAVHASIRRGEADPLMVDETTLDLMVAVASLGGGSPSPPPSDRRRRRSAAVEAVEAVKWRLAGTDPPPTLAGLAAEVHHSPFHLARVFRRATGSTIHSYGRQVRLRRSLDAVLDGGRSLTEVALDHGFSSHSHYTREFSRCFGRPPSEVRRLGYVPTT